MSIDKLYINTYAIKLWSFRALEKLRTHVRGLNMTEYQWKRCISMYFTDISNKNDTWNEEDVYASLVSYVSRKTDIIMDEIREIFEAASQSISIRVCKVPFLEINRMPEGKGTLLTVGDVSFRVPSSFFEKLNSVDNDILMRVVLKYSPLNPDAGFFWSMDPTLIKGLQTGSKYPTIECFASPFNYNIKDFCSLFEEDMLLDYADDARCQGNFFDYIKEIEDVTCRLIINPPYTERMINKMADAVCEHMLKNKNSHIIVVLPDWEDVEGINKLKNLPCAWKTFQFKHHVLFDAIEQKLFKPANINLTYLVNIGGDTNKSAHLLNTISDYMREISAKVKPYPDSI